MIKKQITINDLMEHMEFTRKLYDIVRIVDPIKKQVLDYHGKELISSGSLCYGFWQKDIVCDNCISIRALNEEDTFVKIEYNGDKIYMVTAMPVYLKDRKVVLELLKDITEERILFDLVDESKEDTYRLLKERNTLIAKDALTHLYNRRYINERLPYEIMNSNMHGEYISLMMIDIDDFKEINKSYGHDCGNNILRVFAQVLESKINTEAEWAARYTADSFMICLKNFDPRETQERAGDIRKTIEQYNFTYKSAPIEVTTSIGVYTALKTEISLEQFIEGAEKPLMEAKKQGKNQVVARG